MGDTKKVKYAGRFGPRYGKAIRESVVEVESKQRKKHICPKCESESVKRISTGIFVCKKCKAKFAGGAYTPNTMSGTIVKKMVRTKTFLPLLKELIEQKEPEQEPKEKEDNQKKQKVEEKKQVDSGQV